MEGYLMVREYVAVTEQNATLSVGICEDPKGHAVPRTGRRLGRFGLLNQSSCLKLLMISLVANQLPKASADSICRAFNSIGKKFDLIGMISAFGTSAAAKSLKYSALNDSHFYATGHVGPGSLKVAAALFQATGFPLARLLAFGGLTEDTDDPAKLSSTEGLRYIGLKSNTECPLGNAVGESVVKEHKLLWLEPVKPEENQTESRTTVTAEGNHVERPTPAIAKPEQAKRPTTVIILKAEEPKNPVQVVTLKGPKWSALICGWLPLALTIAVIVNCCVCKLWFVAGLILFGTLSMMIAVLGLRNSCHFKYSEAKLKTDVLPEGDILVVDKNDPDVLNIVKGKETTIQKLFQRNIIFEASYGKYILFLAGSMLSIYVLVSVLYMANVSTSGQIHFAIANLIGLPADMAKASLNGKLGLARRAREEFGIKLYRGDKPLLFDNRTEAISFVVAYATDPMMLKSKKLLPCDGSTWKAWWERLAEECARHPAAPGQNDYGHNDSDSLLDKGLGQYRQRENIARSAGP